MLDQAGKLTDRVIRQRNDAFDRHSGLGYVIGKRVSQILFQFKAYWFDSYAIALFYTRSTMPSHLFGIAPSEVVDSSV